MKRVGNLWPALTSFSNLLGAAQAAAAGKRRRPDVAAFLLELEPNLAALRRDLLSGSYEPGGYRTFEIREPKPRRISAASFRDRVVHHALTRVLEPIFEKRFSPFSFACRKGLGTHAALRLAREACATYRYVLKCDVRKYFASIDHEILKGKLSRVVKCRDTLALAGRIIDGSNPQEDAMFYFPGDDLFTPVERRRGLPLGNQTSQFFANVYLDALDQLIVRRLRPGAYARYVDDFVLFGDSKEELREMRRQTGELLAADRLLLHDGKSRLYQCSEGVTFLGWRLFPCKARLARGNVARFSRRMRRLQEDWEGWRISWDTIRQSVQSWIGHASFGDTVVLRRRVFDRFGFVARGGAPSTGAAGRFLQQQCQEPAGRESQQQQAG
jgi:retron-type reverse transcriptase